MTIQIAMYEEAYKRVGEHLSRLDLDIAVHTFDNSGSLSTPNGVARPQDVSIDYVWLSPDISAQKIQSVAFDLVLSLKSVDVLQTFNAGLDDPYYRKISDRGIRICNSSAQAIAISEYVLANVLAAFHPIEQRHELQRTRQWQRTPFREVAKSNWLIVGFGPIGRAVAVRAKAFGANITVVRRSPTTSDTVDRVGTIADLQKFLPDTDVVVLACPLNEQTRGMVDAAFFGALKPGATLVNIARGALIDDSALIVALDSGRLDCAILDVFHTEPLPADDPIWGHPKIRMTAHTSFSGSGTRQRWDDLFLANIARFARGQALENEVDPKDI